MTNNCWGEKSYFVDLYAQDDWTVDEVTRRVHQVAMLTAATSWWPPVKASLEYG